MIVGSLIDLKISFDINNVEDKDMLKNTIDVLFDSDSILDEDLVEQAHELMGMRIHILDNVDDGKKLLKGVKKFMKLRRRNARKDPKKILKDLNLVDSIALKFGDLIPSGETSYEDFDPDTGFTIKTTLIDVNVDLSIELKDSEYKVKCPKGLLKKLKNARVYIIIEIKILFR